MGGSLEWIWLVNREHCWWNVTVEPIRLAARMRPWTSLHTPRAQGTAMVALDMPVALSTMYRKRRVQRFSVFHVRF